MSINLDPVLNCVDYCLRGVISNLDKATIAVQRYIGPPDFVKVFRDKVLLPENVGNKAKICDEYVQLLFKGFEYDELNQDTSSMLVRELQGEKIASMKRLLNVYCYDIPEVITALDNRVKGATSFISPTDMKMRDGERKGPGVHSKKD